MSKEFKIEAGKYYRIRKNLRAYVVATNKPGASPIFGWLEDGEPHEWTECGSRYEGFHSDSDIISEWVEPERIPWEHLPRWCRWWAKDEGGGEWGYRLMPTVGSVGYCSGDEYFCPVLTEHRSNYTGDWRTSLRERPEGDEFRKVEDKR